MHPGQGFGLLRKCLAPDIIADDIFRCFAQININGVVAVGFGNIVAERQIQHFRHMAQLPVVGFLSGKPRAVNAALLSGADTDNLAVLYIANAVGLCVFQGNQRKYEIAFLRVGQCFVFGYNVFQHAAVDFQVVSSLLERDAVHLLVFQGNGHVIGIDLHHVVIAAFFGFQDFQSFRLITRRDDSVSNFIFDYFSRGHVARIGKRNPVAETAHAVGAAGARVGTGQRGELYFGIDVIHFAQHSVQRITQSSACGRYMFKGGCRHHAGIFLEFFDQLPAVEGVQKVDIAGLAV